MMRLCYLIYWVLVVLFDMVTSWTLAVERVRVRKIPVTELNNFQMKSPKDSRVGIKSLAKLNMGDPDLLGSKTILDRT